VQSKKSLRSTHFSLSSAPSASAYSDEPLKLLMSVPKRLLKKASSRNAVKRVCREAWRLKSAQSGIFKPNKGTLVKLQSVPVFHSQTQLKALVRADLDKLLSKFMAPVVDSSQLLAQASQPEHQR
jgi:RNase P protein component